MRDCGRVAERSRGGATALREAAMLRERRGCRSDNVAGAPTLQEQPGRVALGSVLISGMVIRHHDLDSKSFPRSNRRFVSQEIDECLFYPSMDVTPTWKVIMNIGIVMVETHERLHGALSHLLLRLEVIWSFLEAGSLDDGTLLAGVNFERFYLGVTILREARRPDRETRDGAKERSILAEDEDQVKFPDDDEEERPTHRWISAFYTPYPACQYDAEVVGLTLRTQRLTGMLGSRQAIEFQIANAGDDQDDIVSYRLSDAE
ncbi:hypothetical protein SISNIDRAFT_469125 [Sistotremastrum niveocremeum HHB9708]|uniref:Uncharacterized protein n=1 Tax=Sistotremastrum niveocremeum HHB9708 TaxID=1314777 RepID=A0A164QFE1_9AGAM|nr:hypothetical protein SISNIDRAFT_469125 [Sistotremastrum niveocremeum HHB9708]